MWAFVAIEVAVLAVIVTWVLHIYISWKKTPWYAYIATWIGWLMCFSIVLLVPIDVIAADYDKCREGEEEESCTIPFTYLNYNDRVLLWTILYWGTFILTWLVYPLFQSYVSTGDFTKVDRMREAFRENLFIYVAGAVFGLAIIFYLLAVKLLNWEAIVGILMAAANAWGMFLLVVFMGIGLVEIPRTLWRRVNRDLMLRYMKYELATHSQAKMEGREDLITTLKLVRKISDRIKEGDPLRPFVDVIIAECPTEFREVRQGDGTAEISYSKLVSLHTKVKAVTANANRTEHLYERILYQTFELEDIMRCRTAPSKVIDWTFYPPRTHRFANLVNHLEWFWHSHLATKCTFLLFVGSTLLSILIVWQEVTVSVTDPDLSVFSWMVKGLHLRSVVAQFIVFFPLGYEVLTAYSTLFRLRLFHYYRLIPHQQTDSFSIMFSAAYLCRLAAPLSYNFMNFLHNQLAFSSFEQVMGKMDVVSFLGTHFTIYFPVLIAVVCLSTLFDVYSKIAACCHIKRFRFDETFNDTRIDEGAQILQRERTRLSSSVAQAPFQAPFIRASKSYESLPRVYPQILVPLHALLGTHLQVNCPSVKFAPNNFDWNSYTIEDDINTAKQELIVKEQEREAARLPFKDKYTKNKHSPNPARNSSLNKSNDDIRRGNDDNNSIRRSNEDNVGIRRSNDDINIRRTSDDTSGKWGSREQSGFKRPTFEPQKANSDDDDASGSSRWRLFSKDKNPDEKKLLSGGRRGDDAV